MNNKQKQCLLCYLGHYQGSIDGIWGPKSREATREFQKTYNLTSDGDFGPETEEKIREVICLGSRQEDWWADIQFFTKAEFACKCGRYCNGYPAEMSRTLLEAADRLRSHFGAPVTVSSGLRCRQHNANVGGVSTAATLRERPWISAWQEKRLPPYWNSYSSSRKFTMPMPSTAATFTWM